ncbi:Ca-activated chloride channel family protein [Micromonospora kangleipakensis]|uniref:Ca-activated chloride channel family protein n=1 Tax=Micromonospora kangleipakensis TaxID=1077942 RepID=A0A4V2GCW4_9ACTN|nr:VWA domain-containing protein [Micromonospora kangleipakensis]RZU73596.1 Ca-activated chloride channel family protein [Micromonospora kangleipakensis]
MTWESPGRLWLLLGMVGLAAYYLVMQRRRSRYVARYTNLRLLDRVAPHRPGWRRHLPAGLFLMMLALLVLGFARPTAEVRVPKERATVMIAVDVSTSMLSTDVGPNRLSAAKAAAHDFADALPDSFNVGLVAFAGSAAVLIPPGTDRAALHAGIQRLGEGSTGVPGTAIGDAIDTSLQAVKALDAAAAKDPPPARIVLLSDGANTAGLDPMEASTRAVAAKVPVHTIVFGTAEGTVEFGGRAVQVPADGQTLQAVAKQTGGEFHEAATTRELRGVYGSIGTSVGYRTERQDISARFIGCGLLAAMAAATGSMIWFRRVP